MVSITNPVTAVKVKRQAFEPFFGKLQKIYSMKSTMKLKQALPENETFNMCRHTKDFSDKFITFR